MIGMFTHHNRVIHHDTQRDNQAKQADHVQRQPAQIHQRNGRQHRHRNARRHPQRGAGVQEQEQQHQNQHQPLKTVLHQDIQTGGNSLGAGADQINFHALRQGGFHVLRHVFDLSLNLDRIPGLRTVHPYRNRRVFAHEIHPVAIRPQQADRGHIPHHQGRSIVIRAQHDLRNLIDAAFFHAGADARISPRHIARRVCVHFFGDGGGNLGDGDIMRHQVQAGNFDQHLGGGNAPNGGACHPDREQARDKFIREQAQLFC